MPITNSSPDKGQQPCLTPRSEGKNSDANPLFTIQLETLLSQDFDPVLNVGSEVKSFKTAVNEVPFNGIKSFFEVYKKSDTRNIFLFCVRHNGGN